MLPTGFRTFHFVSFLYVFFFSFLFLLFRFFSHYFVFVFLHFVFLRFFLLLFSLFSFRFFSFRFFSFLFVFFRFSVYRYPQQAPILFTIIVDLHFFDFRNSSIKISILNILFYSQQLSPNRSPHHRRNYIVNFTVSNKISMLWKLK